MNEDYAARASSMAALYHEGKTLAEIGAVYGLTRERVRQVLRVFGLNRQDGGARVRSERNKKRREAARNERSLNRRGCTWDQYVTLRAMKKPTRAFSAQRKSAALRGIGWELTLWQWWTIWQESGRWEQRGRGQGYMMCRVGDTGPYAVGNVYIATGVHNSSEGQKKRRKHPELPIGVTMTPSGRFAADRMIYGEKHHLGTFDTPDAAKASWLRAAPTEARAA